MSYIIHLRMFKTLKALNLKTDVSKCKYVFESQSLPHQEVSFEKKICIIIIWMQPTGKVDIAGQSGKLHWLFKTCIQAV